MTKESPAISQMFNYSAHRNCGNIKTHLLISIIEEIMVKNISNFG
jgi:hypothetical protein